MKDVRVLSVPATGGNVTTVAVLPFSEVGGLSMTPDGRRFVCAVYSSRSDVWIVDDFDPEPGGGTVGGCVAANAGIRVSSA